MNWKVLLESDAFASENKVIYSNTYIHCTILKWSHCHKIKAEFFKPVIFQWHQLPGNALYNEHLQNNLNLHWQLWSFFAWFMLTDFGWFSGYIWAAENKPKNKYLKCGTGNRHENQKPEDSSNNNKNHLIFIIQVQKWIAKTPQHSVTFNRQAEHW